ncbi:MAG: NAD(P)/FAD-dependent oxidoreductase [Thermoplasmatota archaeon]
MALVIVGSGAAGLAAAERLASLGREVVLISRDRRAYSLCTLPYVLSGEVEEERVCTHDERSLRALGVEPLLGREAVSIDPSGRRVALDDGSSLAYDKLLIATGSSPLVPPIPGLERLIPPATGQSAPPPPVHFFNSMEDARRLARACGGAGSALVLGAGLTGLECACALRARGLPVMVVEMEDRVLPRALDRDMSPPVEEALVKGGVALRLRTRVVGLRSSGSGVEVRVRGQDNAEETLSAGVVVLCLGVRPDLALARAAGLKTAAGVLVGPDMRTSDPHIFAAGDVAEYLGRIPATWPTAFRQGEVAALNMAGVESRFSHLNSVAAATILGLPILSVGATVSQLEGGAAWGECARAVSELWRRGGTWRKLVTFDGEVAGYQSVGALALRGLPSLLGRRAGPVVRHLAAFGLHSPALSCLAHPGSGAAGGAAGARVRKRAGVGR